jgi:hypothetical protein
MVTIHPLKLQRKSLVGVYQPPDNWWLASCMRTIICWSLGLSSWEWAWFELAYTVRSSRLVRFAARKCPGEFVMLKRL